MFPRALTLLSAAALLAACDATGTAPPGETAGPNVVRPSAVDTIAVGLAEHVLPAALVDDATLHVAELSGVGALAGGRGGLFAVGESGLTEVDPQPVLAMVAVPGSGIVVATASGVRVWNGALADSELTAALEGRVVNALATRGEALWIATDRELLVLDAGVLSKFDAVTGIVELATSAGASDIVAKDAAGVVTVLREAAGGTFTLRALSAELQAGVSMRAVVPGSGSRIVALDGNALHERVAAGAEVVAWRPVALTTDEADTGATDIESIAVDPLTGAVWAIASASLVRLDHGRVSTLARPAAMSTVRAISVTLDGAVWVSDGATLRRFGNDGPPVTYAGELAVFSENNCERCHAPLKVAHPLDSYEVWAAEIDRIILALEEERMPQDRAPLIGGTVELAKKWRADGLRQ
jgi:hypothetical protein